MLFHTAHSEIQQAGVQYILDTMYDALMKDPKRKFIYVEIAFFYRWWNEQNDEVKNNVKILVNEGKQKHCLIFNRPHVFNFKFLSQYNMDENLK